MTNEFRSIMDWSQPLLLQYDVNYIVIRKSSNFILKCEEEFERRTELLSQLTVDLILYIVLNSTYIYYQYIYTYTHTSNSLQNTHKNNEEYI